MALRRTRETRSKAKIEFDEWWASYRASYIANVPQIYLQMIESAAWYSFQEGIELAAPDAKVWWK